jgi:copper(I)-binding protein
MMMRGPQHQQDELTTTMPYHLTDQLAENSTGKAFLSIILLLFVTVAGSSAWADEDTGADTGAVPETPQVRDAYVRAVPPGQQTSAAFMHISNPGHQTMALVAAESSVARVVELHTHVQEDGMMKMRRVERIELPPGTEVVLQPGGLHLMLIGLKQPLAPGDPVDLHLVFDAGQTIDITADTRTIMPAQRMHHNGQDH